VGNAYAVSRVVVAPVVFRRRVVVATPVVRQAVVVNRVVATPSVRVVAPGVRVRVRVR
jgi:hypothetical protein